MVPTPGVAAAQEQSLSPISALRLARIMVATDFSPASDRALEYGISLARRYQSRLYLTHVLAIGPIMAPELAASSEMQLRAAAERALGEIVESGRFLGVPHEELIEQGTLWPSIEKLIATCKVDLLVLGTHGTGTVQKIFIGSAAEQIFRQARVPVLTVGPAAKGEPPYEVEFKNILFATDFGVGAEREAAYAFSLAQEHRSRLLILHVLPGPKDCNEEAVAKQRQEFRTRMQELIPKISEVLCKVDFHVTFGSAVEEILAVGRETHADLIVMGARTRRGAAGHLPRTKAYRVVCGARCPVLTIRSR